MLFAVFGSVAVGPIIALFVIAVPAVSAAVICSTKGNIAIAPTANGPVHVTVVVAPTVTGAPHVHPVGAVNDTNVALLGSVSTYVAGAPAVNASGPLFVTTCANVTFVLP